MFPVATITDTSNVTFNADQTIAFVEAVLQVPLLGPRPDPRSPALEAEAEGIRRFLSGEQIQCSTGIHDAPTYGYGDLDHHGFWQFPVPPALVEMRRALRDAKDLLNEESGGQDVADFLKAVARVFTESGDGPVADRLRILANRIDAFFVEHPEDR